MLPVSRAVLSLPALPVPPAGVTGLGGGGGRGWGWAGAGRPGRDRGRPRGGSGRSHIAARALLLTLCAGPGRAGLPVGTGAAQGSFCTGLLQHRERAGVPTCIRVFVLCPKGRDSPGVPPAPRGSACPGARPKGHRGHPREPHSAQSPWQRSGDPGHPLCHHTGHSVLPCQPCPQLMGWVPPPEGPQEGAGSSR